MLLSHAVVTHDPYQLVFSIFALVVMAKPAEASLGTANFAKLALSFESKELPIKHIPGPEGVRGRNSDNTMIKEKLGWAPSIPVAVGLKKTYFWIKDMVEKDKAAGIDTTKLGVSEIVVQKTDELDELAKNA